VVFLARHGNPHITAPHNINYRANLWALKRQGVNRVIAVNAVGGVSDRIATGAIVLPHQLIDYSYGREHTFFDGVTRSNCQNDSVEHGLEHALQNSLPPLNHIDFTTPFSNGLRQGVIAAAGEHSINVVEQGVYGVTQGPRLETAAEIDRLERDGCDIVGMTAMPEAALARELEMDYVSICLVVNPAAGRSKSLITMDAIEQVIKEGMVRVRQLLLASIGQL
jgi:5'-methylthioinosine phosphorylase